MRVGIRIHREIDRLVLCHHSHVGLGHVRVDLHLREVVCDRKDYRRLQTRGHGLADIDAARDDLAIDRRCDGAMLEISLSLVERALLDLHACFRLMQVRHRLVEIGLRRILLFHQFLSARCIEFRQFERRLGARQIPFRLCYGCLKKNGIDLRDSIARFHLGIKIGKQLLDVARDLAADLHVHDRIQCAGGGNGLSYRAPRHGHSLIILVPAAAAPSQSEDREQ